MTRACECFHLSTHLPTLTTHACRNRTRPEEAKAHVKKEDAVDSKGQCKDEDVKQECKDKPIEERCVWHRMGQKAAIGIRIEAPFWGDRSEESKGKYKVRAS